MDIEKKEFIEKYFALLELHKPGDLSVRAFSSSWAGPVFLAAFFAACIFGLIYFDRDLSRFLGGVMPALKHGGADRLLTFALIVVAVLGFRSVSKSITERRRVEKELLALRILLDYMRVGKTAFIEYAKAIMPNGDASDYETLANRIYELNH